MTKDEAIEIAKQTGFSVDESSTHYDRHTGLTTPKLGEFASSYVLLKLCNEVERRTLEKAANVCDETGPDDWTGENCAAAIRSMKP